MYLSFVVLFDIYIFGIPKISINNSYSFNGVHFQRYNHKRFPAQPTKDKMEQTAESPPWKKRGPDFVWDPKN